MTDPFDFFQAFKQGFLPPEKADGAFIVTKQHTPTSLALLKHGIPAINLTAPEVDLSIPCVAPNDEAIGRVAAEHFDLPIISQTLYIGPDFRSSHLRLKGFSDALRKAGKPEPHILIESEEMRGGSALRRMKHIQASLKKCRQERPQRLGVFAYSDSFAHAVTIVCKEQQLAIPKDVAIISCGNEEIICSLGLVSLSSIPTNSRQHGMYAAEKLHALMEGKKVPALTLVDPLSVVKRMSSSQVAVEDPVISRALEIIHDKAKTGLRVYELLEYLPISRRSMETRFRAAVGRSPHEEIDRVRVELAFTKLVADQETNAKIALECGFSSATHFEQALRKQTGHSPSYFRGKKSLMRPALE